MTIARDATVPLVPDFGEIARDFDGRTGSVFLCS